MKQTLLQMTQDILSNMTSDEINSISDTTESLQVATIIKQKYNDIISRGDLTKHKQLVQLVGSTDASEPVLMFIPDGLSNIEWIKYFNSSISGASDGPQDFEHDLNTDLSESEDTSDGVAHGYCYVTVLPVKQFIEGVNRFNTSESNVKTFTFQDNSNGFNNNFSFNYKNDRQPKYCTIISNYYVIFDSYDVVQDITLQSSKTMVSGSVLPAFNMSDSFTPNLDEEQFPLLLNEAKALAFYELKQMPHVKAEQEIKRQWSTIQRNKSIDNKPTYFNQLPNFGRR